MQQKLQGPAKLWIDSLQEVFVTWSQFVDKFLNDFPFSVNVSDVHIKMSRTFRQQNETFQEYYYKMLAIGNRGGIPESGIARHIINGINDFDLKKKISNGYQLIDLIRDIMSYCAYNEIKLTQYNFKPKVQSYVANKNAIDQSDKHDKDKVNANVKCFNCFKFGHYSAKCPEPQRKERCGNCNQTNHRTLKCPDKIKQSRDNTANKNVNTIDIDSSNLENEQSKCIIKEIKVNDIDTYAFIDSGSNKTLIRE